MFKYKKKKIMFIITKKINFLYTYIIFAKICHLLFFCYSNLILLLFRNQGSSGKKYVRRHDDITTSSESSSSDGHGLNKYYKRAWDNLGDGGVPPLSRDTEKGHHHPPPRSSRGDEPPRSTGGGGGGGGGGEFRSTRSIGHEGLRDGSEMTVNDVAAMYTRPEKKRHHHHHHNHRHKAHERDIDAEHDRHDKDRDWRDRDRRKY